MMIFFLDWLGMLFYVDIYWVLGVASYNKEPWQHLMETWVYGEISLVFSSYPEGFGLEPKPRITPYHQVFLSPNEEEKGRKEEGLPSLSDGTFCWVFHAGTGLDCSHCSIALFHWSFQGKYANNMKETSRGSRETLGNSRGVRQHSELGRRALEWSV